MKAKVPVDIALDMEEDLPLNKGVENHLFRIVQEAISNTLRHAKATKMDIVLQRRGDTVRLGIRDNGIGFDTLTQIKKQASYGMTNMEERVNELGGSLNIASAPGKGTRIEIRVPLMAEGGQRYGGQAMIRVLLVDDHEMVRIGLAAVLGTEAGIEVVGEAGNGNEGLRLAREYSPDVVLMDLVMDGMDGIETTRRLMEEMPECRVIVLTSFLDDEKMYPVIEAGAFSYLLKTSRASEIADAIRAAARGQSVLESQVASKMMNRFRRPQQVAAQPHEDLTEREMEVLS